MKQRFGAYVRAAGAIVAALCIVSMAALAQQGRRRLSRSPGALSR